MAKTIDSQALEPMNKAFGLAGSGDSGTELLDGTVDQTIDVTSVVRRGRTLAGTEGVFRAVLRNIHGAAEFQASSWLPYAAVAANVIAPYPTPMPDSFDVWLLGCSLEKVSGAGSITDASLQVTQIQQAYGADSVGAAVISTSTFTIASWNSFNSAVTPKYGLTSGREPFKALNFRIPRKGAVVTPGIVFGSNSDGVLTVDAVMLMGVFPVSLGQDVKF